MTNREEVARRVAERERAEFEEWLGREDCPVHWDESANKNAFYGWQAGAEAARREERKRCAETIKALVKASWHGIVGQVCGGCGMNTQEFGQHSTKCPVRQAQALLAALSSEE